ncbi:MAG: DNA-3-methyladenine glycosylase 2 family protein [Clostridiales bacterium]|nr:DNA-3-methyladenine glycosylase 2 family protein [Clostridiales bacterium]
MLQYYSYGEAETGHLKKKDRRLGEAIERIGPIRRPVRPDLFDALIHSIVGQQISSKAQQTVWQRLLDLAGEVTPARIDALSEETLQRCGMSMRKAGYLKGVAEQVLSGGLDLAGLQAQSDQEVIRTLSALRGVGVWTAEMLMIFSMQRPNILSYGDLAIRRGLCMLYRHRALTPALFERYRRRYAPYATVASLYLWAIAGGALEAEPGEAAQDAAEALPV